MPIKVPDHLPAREVLNKENIFIIGEKRAFHQDIRPLRILVLNLMPTKVTTETQLLRLLANSPLQVEVTFLHPKTHRPKNTPQAHMAAFYKTFDEISANKYDGMIITGAPVEHLAFEDVNYWGELQQIMDWGYVNITSTLYICWGAQAGLYHYYGIPKYTLDKKLFGIFPHYVTKDNVPLLRGCDDVLHAPQSRHTEVRRDDIARVPELEVLADSKEAGVYIVGSTDGRQIFVTGHSEYDRQTLQKEYDRDMRRGLEIGIPKNYFPNDDVRQSPLMTWRSHANLLFTNWLNYHVYQVTPYDIQEIHFEPRNAQVSKSLPLK